MGNGRVRAVVVATDDDNDNEEAGNDDARFESSHDCDWSP